MRIINAKERPIKVFGIPFFDQNKVYERVPQELREQLPRLKFLGRRTPGARVCFRTDSPAFTLKITFETLSPDVGMSIFACQAANVLVGERKNAKFLGLCNPPDYNTKTFSKEFTKSEDMEDVTIFLPRNEVISDIEISICANAQILPPTPYQHAPVVFYGSSITEGGCCCRVTNAYNALLSNWLDFDYYNMGFSGSARGELEMADYINTLPMSVFVYDYDHNSPTPEYLWETHEPFFKRIREKNPDIPILMMSRPDFEIDSHGDERRKCIRTTYENAINAGDKNVYFIDGETFFGENERDLCTCDRCHPNDLGFYRMAKVIEPVMKKILDSIN